MPKTETTTATDRSIVQEASGACGDLGTFIPHVIGAITVARLAPAGVLTGFGLFLVSTGLFYGLPLPVQPMKAISAVILTGGLRPGEVAAAGVIIGIVLLVLGTTGFISRLARVIPQSVSAGLQLGLGLLMGVLGLKLMLETPWIGFPALIALFLLGRVPRFPAAPVVLVTAAVIGWMTGGVASAHEAVVASTGLQLVIPTWAEVWRSLGIAVLPQLSLTLTNAVIVTASVSAEPISSKRRDRQRAQSGALVGTSERAALPLRGDADVATARAACRLNIGSGAAPG